VASLTPAPLLDAHLEAFVRAADDEQARAALAEILASQAAPVVRRIVRGQGAARPRRDDGAEDVEHTVLLRLSAHLWRLRRGEEQPVGNLAAYAARAAANACHEWLRVERPQRARLQSRLRYVFRHHPRLVLWERPGGGWLCGFERWREAGVPAAAAAAERWRGRLAVPPVETGAGDDARRLVRLAETIVDAVGAPVRFEDVVTLAADALGIDDRPVQPPAGSPDDSGELPVFPSPAPTIDSALDRQRFVARVWREIAELPLRQRVALLLNLTGAGGQDLLSLVPASGLASWEEVGRMLSLAPADLPRVIAGLPFDDQAIAERLGLTRRQVINLRKCARERLARRLGLARAAHRKAAS
jgi:RNA polymerase sigma factor (sigma-70 family)